MFHWKGVIIDIYIVYNTNILFIKSRFMGTCISHIIPVIDKTLFPFHEFSNAGDIELSWSFYRYGNFSCRNDGSHMVFSVSWDGGIKGLFSSLYLYFIPNNKFNADLSSILHNITQQNRICSLFRCFRKGNALEYIAYDITFILWKQEMNLRLRIFMWTIYQFVRAFYCQVQ